MRGAYRHRKSSTDGESVFVSMTDMTVGFLFIVMILLAFFASKYNDENTVRLDIHQSAVQSRDQVIANLRDEIAQLKQELQLAQQEITQLQQKNTQNLAKIAELEQKLKELQEQVQELKRPDALSEYRTTVSATRLKLLHQLQQRLKDRFPDLPVDVVPDEGTLRFQGEGLFDTNSYQLSTEKQKVVNTLSSALLEVLKCFTFSTNDDESFHQDCSHGFAVIEAVQIEGHTDSRGNDLYNLQLSTNRAVTTFDAMVRQQPDLINRVNIKDEPVLSVAGYGKMRPVRPNDTAQNRATNRRIDIRLIMYTPASNEEIDFMQKRLQP